MHYDKKKINAFHFQNNNVSTIIYLIKETLKRIAFSVYDLIISGKLKKTTY